MVTQYAASNGEVTDQMIHYYAERARGGVGLIMIEATYVERQGDSYKFGLGVDKDAMIPGLTRLTQAIHSGGGKVGLKLQHGGRTANPLTNGGPIKLVSYIPGVTPYEGGTGAHPRRHRRHREGLRGCGRPRKEGRIRSY